MSLRRTGMDREILQSLTDEALMKEYQQGSFEAFNILYERHSQKVYAYLRKRLNRKEEVEDVFQQVFSKLHTSRQNYEEKYLFLQWLFVIARTSLIDHERKRYHKSEISAESQWLESLTKEEPPHQSDGSPYLKNLSPIQKQIVTLKIMDDLTYEEIGSMLKITESNARQILSRAYKKIRKFLRSSTTSAEESKACDGDKT